jgi:NAD-dependent deacetylase
LTGAGISTDSGIPDFRGPDGLWTKDPSAAAMFDLDRYLADADLRRRAWEHRRDHAVWQAQPNAAHRALVALDSAGRLEAIVTQNINGLHQEAGPDPALVIELHGTIWWVRCLACGLRTPMADALARLEAGEPDPECRRCGGIQRSDTVAFGQSLDRTVLARAAAAARDCAVLLAVGTSLQVNPAASLCDVAIRHGARFAVLNATPTPYDDLADAVLRGPVGELLPRLVDA